jgi:tetratricopeptide (TPR) repeat protein
MKKKYLYIAAIAFAIISCKGILDTTPDTSISDASVISDEKSSLAALVGVYDGVQGYYGVNQLAHNVIADNLVNSTAPGNIIPTLVASGTSAFDPTSGAGYSLVYVAINRANFVIKNTAALNSVVIKPASKNQYLGEAYFLRALAYFDLVRTYGGVPIILQPTVSPTQYNGVKRSTVAQTYAQVLSDLNKADSLLTETVVRNRANKFSVYALKARFYLYNENWSKADEYASKVIANSTGFKLVKPFSTFFTTSKSTESVLELTFSASDKNPIYTYLLSPGEGGRLDYIAEPGFVAQLLDPNKGGARKSLVKLLASGAYEVTEYANQDGSSSLYVLRLAEQYLIRAEAKVKNASPDLTNAILDLNVIRNPFRCSRICCNRNHYC